MILSIEAFDFWMQIIEPYRTVGREEVREFDERLRLLYQNGVHYDAILRKS